MMYGASSIHCVITNPSKEPEVVNGLLNSIQSISDEARRALGDPELDREGLLSALAVSYH